MAPEPIPSLFKTPNDVQTSTPCSISLHHKMLARIWVVHLINDPRGVPPRNAERWNVPRHHRARSNGAAIANCDARENRRSHADPAVVPYGDRFRVDDAVAPRLNIIRVVPLGDDSDVGPDKDAIADGDSRAV